MTNRYYHTAIAWRNDAQETFHVLSIFAKAHPDTFTLKEYNALRKENPHIPTLNTLRKYGIIRLNGATYTKKMLKKDVICCPDGFELLFSSYIYDEYVATEIVNNHFGIKTDCTEIAEKIINACIIKKDYPIEIKINLYSIDMCKLAEYF